MLIKICGLRRALDIEYVNNLKPDFIGFVFAKSKRQISIEEALYLKSLLNKDIKAVGVFRDDSIDLIKEAITKGAIDIIQLHGNEDDKYIEEIKKFTDSKIIKAYKDSKYADYLLFDNINPGSGEIFDWNNIKANKPFFLAGGINILNIDEAMKLKPYCIDVSSGVETDGFKDFNKMEKLIKRCRDYE